MKHLRHAVLALGFVFAAIAPARADDAAEARKLIEKAVKAHGGQDKLDKFGGAVSKLKGTFYGQGDGLAMTGEISVAGQDKQRIDLEIDAGGQKIPIVIVLAGDKGWTKIVKDVTELDKDKLEETKEQAYASWVTNLAPLKDKQFTFATTGEIKVENRPALGVKVSSKGHRDIDLYFDKETGLLVKSETRVKDDTTGQEVTEESFPSEYKEVQGTQQAMKFLTKRDGKKFIEGEVTSLELVEKLDASTFTKP
ncbi:hypothetical protein GobsT_31960 [Gemmata obscuriglobus]|uniref:Outer membrane lipoprotein-sorting protein n=1 Tax=Gemmata obscuriglobus TaxID=114 RepID=A0A2Z3HAB9_9BACT|nr:hypothetical protein [Gemmata obscuriglobus]AWM38624.1 hypothetical protein C1280_17620 [Gemmata obscuriglobus]QEG28417.1 hypothetical protein GobsT_31960 [Gemmata obscuriglobus]VTS06371.1 Peptidase M16 domain protein OS=Candidatus Acetothermus autotrophicum GN=HGMM_OP2C286 PE=3 SV=1 [Gemmata obscuriglobus UQM 2246]